MVSPIDNQTYCRKNGQFLRHLRKNGYVDYQHFFETFYPDAIQYCPICGNKSSFRPNKMGYAQTCGTKTCASEISSKVKQNFTEEQHEKRKQKYQQTMKQKSSTELQDIKENRKQTWLRKYGHDHPWKSSSVREKIQTTLTEKYGQPNYSSTLIPNDSKVLLEDKDWLYEQHVIKQKPLYVIGEELLVGDRTVGNYLHMHGISTHNFQRSQWERTLEEFLNELEIDFETNIKTIIPPYELDFYLSDFSIAIELCGLYWHSESQERITRKYHKNKHQLCSEKGIQLLTIFEDEWDKKDIIFAKLKSMTHKLKAHKVYARNTIIDWLVPFKERQEFFDATHIQGDGRGSIWVGLRNKQTTELVALALFSKEPKKNDSYILERFSTKYQVVGGFSKLLHHFEQKTNCRKITTFADNRWSNGKLYELTGFILDKELVEDYAYVYKGKRVHKFNFRHKQLAKRLQNYNEQLSERDNCINHGIYRVWDCGKKRYVKIVD